MYTELTPFQGLLCTFMLAVLVLMANRYTNKETQ